MPIAGFICALAVFARIMTYPLQHDEQFYVPAGILFSFDGLYSGLGFSHFPNLPMLLSLLYGVSGTDQYVLTGRLLIALAWLGAAIALFMLGRGQGRGAIAAVTMIALLIFNPALLDATGMTVTNNFIAVPFALAALVAFLKATDRPEPSAWLAMLCGLLLALTAGFKANYVIIIPPFVIAALLVPRSIGIGRRIARLVLPLFVGGVIGGLPVLYFLLSDPSGFIAHAYSFHRGPQLSFWAAYADTGDPKVIGLRDKLLLAYQIWFAGTSMITFLLLAYLGVLRAGQLRAAERRDIEGLWPVLLVAAVALGAALAGFVPTPSFPQYYTAPIPFAIALVGLLYAKLDAARRAAARPLLMCAIGLSAVVGGPMLLTGLPRLLAPAGWTGPRVHHDAERIARLIRENGGGYGPVATLAPVHALEGGLTIYPHFAMGPFVYRAAEWIPADERRYYDNLASPPTTQQLLRRIPPAAIITGFEGPLEQPFVAFARAGGYPSYRLPIKASEGADAVEIFVRRPRATDPVSPAAPDSSAAAAALRSAPPR
jgi:hypothetical protein